MVHTSSEHHEQLSQWLRHLVEILRTQGGSTWNSLVLGVSGKTAVIELDGIQLQLGAEGGNQLQVHIDYSVEPQPVKFRSDAETLKDVISGRLTLDAAVVNGKIDVRGDLQDLLGIHQIVMGILADIAINPHLQRLWEEFEGLWLQPLSLPLCRPLEQQKPYYGYLINHVPEDILWVEV
ncbi:MULTISPECIES: SCP2 sterol-binding domain-containing protein [unclassified Coleofasciculus]|uniref:SCP2 sterol-binding domain-containing protein n=1 Tax=unclassified Coleofasciculus TaxID=2692782 RepID=UPI00188258B6|nr:MULTISPECIES: SCP2 sterol-binding domain-containing protein [unclassified Coleofasciculus]MBE9125088.1 SCP2 sterol-binding domain-containing protein [Coleofasciculus sp. LEGE 07081]MBE9150091.1 SCP2 sterol-binding domain-containing protein [Coleofasciculus sp. LEGE 07092]